MKSYKWTTIIKKVSFIYNPFWWDWYMSLY